MILNLGSINVDHVHRVQRFPVAGETVADLDYSVGLGGKGANMSMAAALAGADVRHIGAVGPDGAWAVERLATAGVDTQAIATMQAATGHAVILVDPGGENRIVIHGGANRALDDAAVLRALRAGRPGDWFLCQAETSLVPEMAAHARAVGLKVAYAAAPFDPAVAATVLPLVDLLVVNEGEATALALHLRREVAALGVPHLMVTLGARGARYASAELELEMPAFPVEPVDTTGAGDCFTGYVLAGLDAGLPVEAALRRATAAAAIQVSRPGAAEAIPHAREVDAFLAERTA